MMNSESPRSHARRDVIGIAMQRHIHHDSFATAAAQREFDPVELLETSGDHNTGHMPDDLTRDHARRMHYAAYRSGRARTAADATRWRAHYIGLRDCIVLGNRKLIFRPVRRIAHRDRADDLIGDCHIVLFHVVAAFNPWMGIRFSTYACTCLLRALSRLSQKHSADRLSSSISFDLLPDGKILGERNIRKSEAAVIPIEEYLRKDHPLLTDREKRILIQRFNIREDAGSQTLEHIGREMGLSKERVRQVQASAIIKLRKAMRVTSERL